MSKIRTTKPSNENKYYLKSPTGYKDGTPYSRYTYEETDEKDEEDLQET